MVGFRLKFYVFIAQSLYFLKGYFKEGVEKGEDNNTLDSLLLIRSLDRLLLGLNILDKLSELVLELIKRGSHNIRL